MASWRGPFERVADAEQKGGDLEGREERSKVSLDGPEAHKGLPTRDCPVGDK